MDDGGGAEQNATPEAGELVHTSAFNPTNACSRCMSSAFLLPYGTESRTRRGLAMTVHGTLLRRKSAVDAVNAGIIASPARRCIGTCIMIVAYRRSGGGGCGRASERAMTCLSPRVRRNRPDKYHVRTIFGRPTLSRQADEVELMDQLRPRRTAPTSIG
jgi:hypothetical protein